MKEWINEVLIIALVVFVIIGAASWVYVLTDWGSLFYEVGKLAGEFKRGMEAAP